jgi:MFS family permease
MAKSAVWMLVTQGGGFLGYLTFGMVADAIGRRPAYSIYSVFWAVGLLMITVLWSSVGGDPGIILACMFFVGFGTGMFGGYGPLFAEIFPTDIRNTAMGAAFNLARGVQFITPVVIALIATRYGLSGGIALAAVFALATGAWVWLFPETKGARLSDADLQLSPGEPATIGRAAAISDEQLVELKPIGTEIRCAAGGMSPAGRVGVRGLN